MFRAICGHVPNTIVIPARQRHGQFTFPKLICHEEKHHFPALTCLTYLIYLQIPDSERLKRKGFVTFRSFQRQYREDILILSVRSSTCPFLHVIIKNRPHLLSSYMSVNERGYYCRINVSAASQMRIGIAVRNVT